MTASISFGRKALSALVAATVIGATFAPVAASARDHHRGRNAAFIGSGLLLGTLIAAGAAASEVEVVERDCWIEKRRSVDEFGDVYVRRVRVCD